MSFIERRVMINQSLIALSHCHLPISSSSRSAVSSFVSSLLSNRLALRLVVVLLLRLVSLRRRLLSVPSSYPSSLILVGSSIRSSSHRCRFQLPPVLPHCLIASSYLAALSISSSPSPLPDGKIELTQTARPFSPPPSSNRIPRREATGTRARRHEMRKTSCRRHGHETQRARRKNTTRHHEQPRRDAGRNERIRTA